MGNDESKLDTKDREIEKMRVEAEENERRHQYAVEADRSRREALNYELDKMRQEAKVNERRRLQEAEEAEKIRSDALAAELQRIRLEAEKTEDEKERKRLQAEKLEAEKERDRLQTEKREAEERKLAKPWRTLPKGENWDEKLHQKLLDDIISECGFEDLKSIRILLVGPIKAGKSSFINTVASIDRRRIANPMEAGESTKSLSRELQQYKPRRILKNVILLDTMGVEEQEEEGFHVQDVIYLIGGHVKPNYKFNPRSPITEKDPKYKANPTPADRAHCILIVIPATLIDSDSLSDAAKKKIAVLRDHIRKTDAPIVILLTKVDQIDENVDDDVTKVYFSTPVKMAVKKTQELFGIPENNIFPIRNYSSEVELDEKMNILTLLALKKMMEIAVDRLEKEQDNREEED